MNKEYIKIQQKFDGLQATTEAGVIMVFPVIVEKENNPEGDKGFLIKIVNNFGSGVKFLLTLDGADKLQSLLGQAINNFAILQKDNK